MRVCVVLSICMILIASCEKKPFVRCTSDAPLFTTEIANKVIENWGNQVSSYSTGGAAGYDDVYESAAYFTANNYLQQAILLPTVSPVTRDTTQSIYDYFTHFLSDHPKMTNNPGKPQAGGPFVTLTNCGSGVVSGYYNFLFATPSDDGEPTSARYTFQFQYLSSPNTVSVKVISGPKAGQTIEVNQPAGRWYIVMQNSAKLPMK